MASDEENDFNSQNITQQSAKRKRTTRATIQHKWEEEDINQLIGAVEERQPLWNPAQKEHSNRNTVKMLWNEVYEDVFKQKFDAGEIICKWNNLRVQWRTYDAKYKGTKSGQAYAPKQKWQFFDSLQFLRINEPNNMIAVSNLDTAVSIYFIQILYFKYYNIENRLRLRLQSSLSKLFASHSLSFLHRFLYRSVCRALVFLLFLLIPLHFPLHLIPQNNLPLLCR